MNIGTILIAIAIAVLVFMIINNYFGASWIVSLVSGFVTSWLYYLVLIRNYHASLRSSNNISVYTQGFFQRYLGFEEIRECLVFKRPNFSNNRFYWLNGFEKLYYTSHCDEEKTLFNLFEKIQFTDRTNTLDKFAECFFIDVLVEGDVEKRELHDHRFTSFKKGKHFVAVCYDYTGLTNDFLNNFDLGTKTPDILLQIDDYFYIIDVKNKQNEELVYHKYHNATKLGTNTSVFSICTNIRQNTTVDGVDIKCCYEDKHVSGVAMALFADLFEIPSARINALYKSCYINYYLDRIYWLQSFSAKEILKTTF
jgi:hypothetical protein